MPPRFGEFRELRRGAEYGFEVWDGMFWQPFNTRQEAEEYLARLEEAARSDLQPADPEPIRTGPPNPPYLGGGTTRPRTEMERDLEAMHGITFNDDPDTGIAQDSDGEMRVVVGGSFLPNSNGRVYPGPVMQAVIEAYQNGERPPVLHRTVTPVRRIGDPPGQVRELIPGRTYVEPGVFTQQVDAPDYLRIQPLEVQEPTLVQAQGEELDRLARILGLERERNWPQGIGRAIEPDRDLRERMLTVLQAHMPAGSVPVDMQISHDGSHVNVSMSVRTPIPAEFVQVDISLERDDNIIDEESRWKQIGEELNADKSTDKSG